MRRGKAVYSIKWKGHLQCRRELANVLFDPSVELGFSIKFFWAGASIDDSGRDLFGLAFQNLVQGSFWMGAFSAAGHQRRVYDDARKPRGKRRPPLKRAEAGERLAQALL